VVFIVCFSVLLIVFSIVEACSKIIEFLKTGLRPGFPGHGVLFNGNVNRPSKMRRSLF
jgi:hypothetical protein